MPGHAGRVYTEGEGRRAASEGRAGRARGRRAPGPAPWGSIPAWPPLVVTLNINLTSVCLSPSPANGGG